MGHYESTYAPVLPRNNPSFIFACTLASDDTSRSRRPIFKCRRKENSQDVVSSSFKWPWRFFAGMCRPRQG